MNRLLSAINQSQNLDFVIPIKSFSSTGGTLTLKAHVATTVTILNGYFYDEDYTSNPVKSKTIGTTDTVLYMKYASSGITDVLTVTKGLLLLSTIKSLASTYIALFGTIPQLPYNLTYLSLTGGNHTVTCPSIMPRSMTFYSLNGNSLNFTTTEFGGNGVLTSLLLSNFRTSPLSKAEFSALLCSIDQHTGDQLPATATIAEISSLVDINQGGYWGDFSGTAAPSAVALALRSIMLWKACTLTLTGWGCVLPTVGNDGSGFPEGFGAWWFAEENRLMVKRTNNTLRAISKWSPAHDIIIDIGTSAYNGIYTVQGVYFNANTKPVPVQKDDVSGVTTAYYASSDNAPGPYSIRRSGASAYGWAGGAHLTQDDEPGNTTWEQITGVDSVARTLTLLDASDYPVPADGQYHCIYIKLWSGSAYVSQGRYTYSGKNGNVLTGVNVLYSGNLGDPDIVTGIADPVHPAKAVFVLHSVTAGVPAYLLDGAPLANGVWTFGTHLSAAMNNQIWDADTQRTNPNNPELWDMLINELITFYLYPGGSIDVLCSSVVENDSEVAVYYGQQGQAMNLTGFAATKLHYGHSSNVTLRNVANDLNSGAISGYPNADRFIYYNPTNKWIYVQKMDLSSLTPADYANMIDDLDTHYRYFNTTKSYFTNISGQVLEEDDVVEWKGGYHYKYNLSTSSNSLAYFTYEDGHLYFCVDITGSETFPYAETISHVAINSKVLTVVQKDDTITLTGQVGSVVTIGAGGLEIAATAYGTLKILVS